MYAGPNTLVGAATPGEPMDMMNEPAANAVLGGVDLDLFLIIF